MSHDEKDSQCVATLTDPDRTALVLVARPQSGSLAEAARTAHELAAIGIHATHLIINAVLPASETAEPLAASIWQSEQRAIANIPQHLHGLETVQV